MEAGAEGAAGDYLGIAMKQENRLVAELFRYLAPFCDTTKELYICVDGFAAQSAVGAGRLRDPVLPDLWFSLVGQEAPTFIEAKILDENNRAMLMQSQLTSWRTTGRGSYKPHFWIAGNREFNRFYFWSHSDFLVRLDPSRARSITATFRIPDQTLEFDHIAKLALHVLREAKGR